MESSQGSDEIMEWLGLSCEPLGYLNLTVQPLRIIKNLPFSQALLRRNLRVDQLCGFRDAVHRL